MMYQGWSLCQALHFGITPHPQVSRLLKFLKGSNAQGCEKEIDDLMRTHYACYLLPQIPIG